MASIDGKQLKEYGQTTLIKSSDAIGVEKLDGGTKWANFSDVCKNIYIPDITESKVKFPEIDADDSFPVIIGKLKKWQQDMKTNIAEYLNQSAVIAEFGDSPEEETLQAQIISAALAYKMQQAIDKAAKEIGDLESDFQIQKREQMASYGFFGKEWDLDELMSLVKAGKFDKFAVGDFFKEVTSSNETIIFEVAHKLGEFNEIIINPRKIFETTYTFNSTAANAGGYTASLMPSNLETEFNKLSSKLQGYVKEVRRLENKKGSWGWQNRKIFLPNTYELIGHTAWAGAYGSTGFGQLKLFDGGTAHLRKSDTQYIWSADASADTTEFLAINAQADESMSISRRPANEKQGIAPLMVLN